MKTLKKLRIGTAEVRLSSNSDANIGYPRVVKTNLMMRMELEVVVIEVQVDQRGMMVDMALVRGLKV